MGERGSVRKIRCDKKRDIKPTVTLELKDAIFRLAYITRTKVKDLCEEMIHFAFQNSDIIDRLSVSFVRDIRMNDTMFRGHVGNIRFERCEQGSCSRVHMRITQPTYDNLAMLAYALDLNPSRVCAILLDVCMHDFRFLNSYITQFLKSELTHAQMHEFRDMLQYINKNSKNLLTIPSLLSAIVDTVNDPLNVRKSMDEFLIHHWRK